MQRRTAAIRMGIGLVVIAFCFASPARAVDTGNDSGSETIVDCNDGWEQLNCLECCGCTAESCDPSNCPTQDTTCCGGHGEDCPVIDGRPITELTISVRGVDLKYSNDVQTDGKSGRQYVHLGLSVHLRAGTPAFKENLSIALNTRVVGDDASIGSMLLAVAFLDKGANALPALHTLGYDVEVTNAAPATTCGSLTEQAKCHALANQLSQAIDASLALAEPSLRQAFRDGVADLGLASCAPPIFVP